MLRPCLCSTSGLIRRFSLVKPQFLFLSSPNRHVQTTADHVPLRKQLKQEARALKAHKKQRREEEEASRQKWELTVGIEIHAQLDTQSKLFSRSS